MRVDCLPRWSLSVPQNLLQRCTSPFLRKAVLSRLKSLEKGSLVLNDGADRFELGDPCDGTDLHVQLEVLNPAFYAAVARNGSIGAAESYIKGHWTSRDLTRLIRLLVRNRAAMLSVDGGLSSFSAPIHRLMHWLNRNTPQGSRENIAAHYDLGNDFFAQFLDPTWMYSSAVFERDDMSLEDASRAKNERLCRMLDLQETDHLLEIGTGWGGFALHAAQTRGCRITTATISERQFEFARERVRAAGLADRVEVVFCDYRELRGAYDKLISIEMIEAVGHQYLGQYLECCDRLLKTGGRLALQCITIGDSDFDRHTAEVDFIKRYIFPGSCLVNTNRIRSLLQGTALSIQIADDITPHYVRTLQEWRRRFHQNFESVKKLGFDEQFIRMWDYYFNYCEAGFAENYIGASQLLLTKNR